MLQVIVAFLCACFEPEEGERDEVVDFNEVLPPVLEMEPLGEKKVGSEASESTAGRSVDEIQDCRERVASDASFSSIPSEISNSRDLIAQGGFGVVVKVVEEGVEFALKSETIENYDCVAQEADILSHLDHQNIIKLSGAYFDMDFVYLKFPLREKTLDDLELDEEQIKKIFLQVLDAVQYMHLVKDIIHRDLKPDNILLDDRNKPEVIDFGTATHMEGKERTFTYCGTPDYMAPEIEDEEGYTKAVDCYSLGVTIDEILWDMPEDEFDAKFKAVETRPTLSDLVDMLR